MGDKAGDVRPRATKRPDGSLTRDRVATALPDAPSTLIDFICQMEPGERETYVKRLQVMPAEHLREIENRRQYTLKLYPHAFSATGLSSEERAHLAREFRMTDPLCGPIFYLNLVLLLIGLACFCVYLYISRGFNALVWLQNFLLKLLDPGLPQD